MAITVNGTTMTDVTVNGTAMDVINVNGVEVFRKQLSPIWYNGIITTCYGDYRFYTNPDTIKETYGVSLPTQQSADWQYTLYMDINKVDSQKCCIIFKDFISVKLQFYHNYPDTLKFRWGSCTKSATCAGLSSGSGVVSYRDQYCSGDLTYIEITGDSNNDCFFMYKDSNASAMSSSKATIKIFPGQYSGLGGYRYY